MSVLVILVVAATIAYRVFNAAPPPPETPAETAVQPRPQSAAVRTEPMAAPDAADAGEEEPDCITMDELNAHPLIRQVQSQADAAATNGADIEKFRGLDDATVRGYADQGDSAAMVVVGAMSVMRAFRMDASRAVDWLANGGELEGVVMEQQQMSSDAGLALNDAAYWFYQAALHGKVLALQHYGQVRGQLFGGPVGLGWIEQQEYDALEPDQQLDLSPANMYSNVAMEMKPPAGAGAIPYSLLLASGTEATRRIREDIRNEFSAAVSDAGLDSPATSAADIAELQRLRSRLCATDSSQR